ncbi:MAG: DNA-binding protein [Pelagibacteraceae bacterium]|jgi:hypothetical protein|nr:DNA-binding protein [Pelagibacteraceae bacterium]
MQLVTEKYLSKKLSISVAKLRKDRILGQGIPAIKIGASVRYSIDDVLAHIEKNKIFKTLKDSP